MPVWHVYRSFDVAPTGKHLRRFDDDTVLDEDESAARKPFLTVERAVRAISIHARRVLHL